MYSSKLISSGLEEGGGKDGYWGLGVGGGEEEGRFWALGVRLVFCIVILLGFGSWGLEVEKGIRDCVLIIIVHLKSDTHL